jgi:hypothetical protein
MATNSPNYEVLHQEHAATGTRAWRTFADNEEHARVLCERQHPGTTVHRVSRLAPERGTIARIPDGSGTMKPEDVQAFVKRGQAAQAAVDKVAPPRPEHPNVVDAKKRARETGKYTRTSGISVTIWAGGETHHIYAPDGTEVCTVMAAAYADPYVKPRLVDVMADTLLAHLNREGK